MPQDQKKFYRELKRVIKKAGKRKMRKFLNDAITADPETAHEAEFDFGRSSSKWLNGMDDEKKNQYLARKQDDDRPHGEMEIKP